MYLKIIANLLAMLGLVGATAIGSLHPLSDEFINLINEKQNTWKAGRNFHRDTSLEYLEHLCGLLETNTKVIEASILDVHIVSVPESFDARVEWPNCPSLNEIRDQADCGSCWAIAAVEVMTDRVCIHSNFTKHFHFSAADVMACAGHGCNGSYLFEAWLYWKDAGIVSGGNYGSNEGCKPYPISPCEHHKVGVRRNCSLVRADTPLCFTTCRKGYSVSYKNDKLRGTLDYESFNNEDQMKTEIFLNGPIMCRFTVYEDFYSYTSGVYVHTVGQRKGLHAVKIIGWGVENEVKYWLVANSWNEDWGDKGFFKVIRGINHVGIESYCIGGKPLD